MRYLGIFIVASISFKCDFSHARSSFCKAANSIMSQVGSSASEEVLVHLLKTKCLPILLYGMEATGLNGREASASDFALRRFVIKVFKSTNNVIIEGIYDFMGLEKPSLSARTRDDRFLCKFDILNNISCNI